MHETPGRSLRCATTAQTGTVPDWVEPCGPDVLGRAAPPKEHTISSTSTLPLERDGFARASAKSGRRFNSARLHRLIASSRVIRSLSIGVLARLELMLLSGHKEPDVMAAIQSARSGRESLLSGNEAFTLFSIARAQSGIEGEMAEVGVYQGCSAKIINSASSGRPLHLFDTFSGLPDPDAEERARMRAGHYAASIEGVRDFLSGLPAISFYPGLFPDTAGPVAGRRFSFVHLDVDLKSSTRACLEFFYPRLVPGGVLLTHDYSYLDGVREAFGEFFADKQERPIELPTSQAMLVKLGSALPSDGGVHSPSAGLA